MSDLYYYAHQLGQRLPQPFGLRELYQDFATGRTGADTLAHHLDPCPPIVPRLYLRGSLVLARAVEAIGTRGYPEGWSEWDGPFTLDQAMEIEATERRRAWPGPVNHDPVVVGLSWHDAGPAMSCGVLLLQALGPGSWWPEG